jgi:hypothetical protein
LFCVPYLTYLLEFSPVRVGDDGPEERREVAEQVEDMVDDGCRRIRVPQFLGQVDRQNCCEERVAKKIKRTQVMKQQSMLAVDEI